MTEGAGPGATGDGDGRRDFDFLFGSWRVLNRRLASVLLRRDCTDWVEFESTAETRPILDDLGNIDDYRAPAFPAGRALAAVTVRLFDPTTRLWRIWSASTNRPGQIDPPVVGRFTNGRGQFFCAQELHGELIRVRFEWRDITSMSARWEQAFSYDQGGSWETNWTMDLTRSEASG